MYITVSTNAPTDISDVSEICSRQHDLLPLASLFFQKLKISFSIYLNGIYTVVKKIQGKNKKFILGSKVLTANTLLIFLSQHQCLDVKPFLKFALQKCQLHVPLYFLAVY